MLMYALGPCLFTSTNTHHEYHATFFHELAVRTSHNMFGSHLELKISETKTAIEAYISVIADKHQDDGACQASCRLFHAAIGCMSMHSECALMMESRSGLSVTAPMGDQLRVARDQRAGFSSRALLYSA